MSLFRDSFDQIPEAFEQFASMGLVLAFALLLGWIAAHGALWILRRIAAHPENQGLAPFELRWRRPAKWLFPLFFVNLAINSLSPIDDNLAEPLLRIVNLMIIAGVAGFAIRTVKATEDFVKLRYDVGVKDNLRARKVHTQMRVFEKVFIVLIIVIAAALMLMTFERIRHLGVSIFASAGIAGIVIGLAAQKTIGTFIAGIQIAITQPIRMDDVVIVEGEWGVIEEITLTYVVVRIWDLRRLILPITYFIEKPFQNWTRVSADILGTIFLYVDYRLPLDKLRSELRRICESSDFWDNKVCELVVTDALQHNLQLRALISARDSSQAWNLRCLVREKLIDFIQQEYPEFLPRFRAELASTGANGSDLFRGPDSSTEGPPSATPHGSPDVSHP